MTLLCHNVAGPSSVVAMVLATVCSLMDFPAIMAMLARSGKCLFYTDLNTDIDECSEDTHACTQMCVNTNGFFSCECRGGYELIDERTCRGMILL